MQSHLRPDKSSPSGIRLRDDPLKFADDSDVDTESESRLMSLTLAHCKKLRYYEPVSCNILSGLNTQYGNCMAINRYVTYNQGIFILYLTFI